MRRHNEVCQQVSRSLSNKYDASNIYTEPLVTTVVGNFRPDLVVIDKTRSHAFIADVAIPYEAHSSTLLETEASKATKHSTQPIANAIKLAYGVRSVSSEGIPIGARGAVLPNKSTYCGVKFTNSQLCTLAQSAIKGSVFTFNTFMSA